MIDRLSVWWRARTPREQRLVQIAGFLLFAIIVPGLIFSAASTFRRDAAAEYASAQAITADVARLKSAVRDHPIEAPTGSTRERALAAAQAQGVAVASLETAGQGRVRVVFQPADSLAVFKWVEAMGRAGASVEQGAITRVGESDQVRAEFVVAE